MPCIFHPFNHAEYTKSTLLVYDVGGIQRIPDYQKCHFMCVCEGVVENQPRAKILRVDLQK